jgi:predicted amidohydrolase
VKVALAQYEAAESVEANVQKAERLVEAAAVGGAHLVALQELFTSLYFPLAPTSDRNFQLAEPIDGPSVGAMRKLAGRLGIHLVVPFYEEAAGPRFFNSSALIGPSGDVLGLYRKNHIPRVHLDGPGWREIDEKYYFEPSTLGYPVFSTELGRIGMLVCHDRHFPESARVLALRGAELVVIPSASRGIPGAASVTDVWMTELKALAITNVMFVCGINRVGCECDEVFAGRSAVVGPEGHVLAEAGSGEQVITAEVDLGRVRALRIARGFLRDRRPDTYEELVR